MVHPVRFQRRALGRTLWDRQKEIARAVRTHRSISIKGCHGSGKTFLVAGLVPWWILSDPEAICLWIAPTLRQVKTGWGEVITAVGAMHKRLPLPTTTGWKLGPNNYAQGFSSSKGVNAQGFHGKRVLIIADEAIGISPDLWDAIEGVRAAGDVTVIKLCNPTVPSGPVFEDFTRLRGTPGHATVTISAFDTPNLHGLTMEKLLALPEEDLEVAPMPWLTRRRWVREMFYKWGPNNPRFLSRVLGEFPTQADDAVFSLSWIERASLPVDPDDLAPYVAARQYLQVGFDIAGPGDDETVATARMGPFVVGMEAWPDADPLDKARKFLTDLAIRFPGHRMVLVGDTVGIGYYFMRALARDGYDVRGFVANGAALDPVLYKNAKAEAYFWLRECMRDGHVLGLVDEDTKAQLSDVRYRERLGKIEIEHKAEARERGSSSPDRAESLMIAYVRLVPRQTVVTFGPGAGYQISPV